MHIKDCGVFIVGYAEYLSEGMNGSSVGFEAEYHRMRYATLLRNYSFQKAKKGYASDNDDPPRPRTKNIFLPDETKIEALGNTQEEKDSSEVQIKSVLVENISNRASSSSSEDDEPFYKIDKNAILKSIAFPSLRNLSGDPSHFDSSSQEKTSGDEHLCYPNHHVHRTPSLSINSDLQGDVQCAYCEEEREFLKTLVNMFDGIEILKEEKFCPPARFWINNKANALGIPVTRQKDSVTGDYFDTVNGMKFLKFKDGFLYKTVFIRSIGYKVQPTLDDIEKFCGAKGDDNERAERLSFSTLPVKNQRKKHFKEGDRVVVLNEELKIIQG
ncbi:hypothetical protein CQW23_06337 [Capsicum baccatum]|uniref:Spt5 KOW domain-containing protein n=1 Tax=Capsicum baccatum TaxID=33114 RepID=A0A2G2X315_CAPBA|nr:hypothetical protein CQW23_06337 [Capsicum baccatum]